MRTRLMHTVGMLVGVVLSGTSIHRILPILTLLPPRRPAPKIPGLTLSKRLEQFASINFHKIFSNYILNSIIINTLHMVDKFFLFIPPISLYS